MEKKRTVGFTAKLLSNHYYLNEVSVEGKETSRFNFNIANYDHYAAQIIRAGNCITLLTTKFTITEDSFWNINYVEDLTKYVFWTFNKSFVLKVTDKIEGLTLTILKRCQELLQENGAPYNNELSIGADEELEWCFVKNEKLKKDPKFSQMYRLDEQNRSTILKAVEKRIKDFATPIALDQMSEYPALTEGERQTASRTVLFLEVLRPMGGSQEETLKFLKQTTNQAGFEFNIFSRVPRLENGKNPYGLNGCMAAMIDCFYQLNYFKKDYTLEEIFRAYLRYSGNTIGKIKTFISEFRQDNSFIKHSEKLKELRINRLP